MKVSIGDIVDTSTANSLPAWSLIRRVDNPDNPHQLTPLDKEEIKFYALRKLPDGRWLGESPSRHWGGIGLGLWEVLAIPVEIQEERQIPFYVDPVHSSASTLGRLGGLAKSEAKAISSRENGKKGGRPRKVRKGVNIETIEESNLDLFK